VFSQTGLKVGSGRLLAANAMLWANMMTCPLKTECRSAPRIQPAERITLHDLAKLMVAVENNAKAENNALFH
jgi:hypothetical protein